MTGLTPKQKRYVKEVVAGKSKQQAAITAGYSPTTAKNAYDKVEKVGVKKAIEKALEKAGLTEDRIAAKINEGMEAQKIISANITSKDADINTKDFIEVPDYQTQHKFLETAIRLKGLNVKDDAPPQIMNFVQILQQHIKEYE